MFFTTGYPKNRTVNKAAGTTKRILVTFSCENRRRADRVFRGLDTAGGELQHRLFEIIRAESDPQKASKLLDDEMKASLKKLPGTIRTSLESETARRTNAAVLNNKWMRYFLAYDPAPALRQVHCPVLIRVHYPVLIRVRCPVPNRVDQAGTGERTWQPTSSRRTPPCP